MSTPTQVKPETTPQVRAARRSRGGIRGRERVAGWVFVAPAVTLLVMFLAIPVLMALYVSFTDWNGNGSPFSSSVPKAGGSNYSGLFTEDSLARQDFMTSIRNIFYFTIVVVPAQTALALFLALIVNARMLKGKGFFRSAFYFPSVTSSVAITTVFRPPARAQGRRAGRPRRGQPGHLRRTRRPHPAVLGRRPGGVTAGRRLTGPRRTRRLAGQARGRAGRR